MIDLINRALIFATGAHGQQRRKYTGEPYINHPVAVAEIVRSVPHTQEMIAAAILHDTVEDTGTPLNAIYAEFGVGVSALVDWLTDISRPEHGNRATRKAIDRAHIAAAPPEAKTIKLADLIDNSASIMEHDPSFAAVYLREKAALLEVLRDGDAVLWDRASAVVSAGLPTVTQLLTSPAASTHTG